MRANLRMTMKILLWLTALTLLLVGCVSCGTEGDGKETETAKTQIGESGVVRPAPDFTVQDIYGAPVRLRDFHGTPVVINFWASWCEPCKAEMPDLQKVYDTYGDRVQFMVIDMPDGNTETVDLAKEYIQQTGYTFPVYFDTTYAAATAYNVRTIPRTYFINAKGQIVHSLTEMATEAQFVEGIEKALQ